MIAVDTSGVVGMGMTRAMVNTEIRRLGEIVARSQHLAELNRKAERFAVVAAHHKTASEAAGRAAALGRTHPTARSLETVSRAIPGCTALSWVEDLMVGHVQTAKGWKQVLPSTAPHVAQRSGAPEGAAGGFTC